MSLGTIYCVIDRSGSMDSCRTDTIGGFNAFLSDQSPDQTININLFDHEYTELYSGSVKDAIKMSLENFVPRGNTALYDAIGKTVLKASERPEPQQPPQDPQGEPIIVILTDGEENSSREFTRDHIKKLIDEKTKLGWKFIFLAANQDAVLTASTIGVSQHSAMTFSPKNVDTVFRCTSSAIKRSGGKTPIEFSPAEREESQASC
jgi:hypothetical protein